MARSSLGDNVVLPPVRPIVLSMWKKINEINKNEGKTKLHVSGFRVTNGHWDLLLSNFGRHSCARPIRSISPSSCIDRSISYVVISHAFQWKRIHSKMNKKQRTITEMHTDECWTGQWMNIIPLNIGSICVGTTPVNTLRVYDIYMHITIGRGTLNPFRL